MATYRRTALGDIAFAGCRHPVKAATWDDGEDVIEIACRVCGRVLGIIERWEETEENTLRLLAANGIIHIRHSLPDEVA